MIQRLENSGISKGFIENIEKIASALERAGIEFFNSGKPGVCLHPQHDHTPTEANQDGQS